MPRRLWELFDEALSTGRDLVTSSPQTLGSMTGTSFVDSDASKKKLDVVTQVMAKVDYSDFSNFVFFNSALDYFNISGERILNEYPYDGALSDVIAFESSSDGYQRHLLEVWPHISGAGSFSGTVSNPGTIVYAAANDLGLVSGSSQTGLLGLGTSSLTVEFHAGWTAPPAGSASILLQRVNSSGSEAYSVYATSPSASVHLRLIPTSGSAIDVSASMGSGSYLGGRYYAWTVQNTTSSLDIKFYTTETGSDGWFDGVQSPTLFSSWSFSPVSFDQDYGKFYVGSGSISGSTTALANANVTELRVWNTVRSLAEIKADYNLRIYSDPDLLLYWRFAEGYSGSTTNSATKIRDYSGHKIDGTIFNMNSSGSAFWLPSSNVGGFGMSPQDLGEPVLSSVDSNLLSFIKAQQLSGSSYDRDNTNLATNLVPAKFIDLEDERQTSVLKNLLFLLGRQFDEIKVKIDQFTNLTRANYTQFDQVPDALLADALRFWGWTPKGNFLSKEALQYFFGYDVLSGTSSQYDNQRLDKQLYEIKNEFWRRTLINLPYLYKTKGTRESIESLLRIYGLNEKTVKLKEFGFQPRTSIQTRRINSDKSETAMRLTGSFSGTLVGSTGTALPSFTFPVSVEMNVIFPSVSDNLMSPIAQTGSLYSWHQPGFPFSKDELFGYVRSLTGSTGSFFYLDSNSGGASAIPSGTFSGTFPVFDGRPYHFTLIRSGSTATLDVRHLDSDSIDLHLSSSINVPGLSQLTGTWPLFSLNYFAPWVSKGEQWINELRVWSDSLTSQEIEDHSLNPFSYGTDEIADQSNLLFHQRYDQDLDKSLGSGLGRDFTGNGRHAQTNTSQAIIYDRFLFDYNFIAPPDYGWNEEKIRTFDVTVLPAGDQFLESSAVSLEFNLVDKLNEDISLMLSTIDNWNNLIGLPANRHRETYHDLDSLRRQYFKRLSGRLNFRVFADFLDFFDRSFLDLIKRLLPARAQFKGAEFVVESHMLERPKIQYTYRRADATQQIQGILKIYGVDSVSGSQIYTGSTTPPSGPLGHILDGNSLALWRFDESSNTDDLLDITSNATLSQVNSPGVIAGQVDGSRVFDPNISEQYFSGSRTADIYTALNNEWSYEQWVYLDSAQALSSGFSILPLMWVGRHGGNAGLVHIEVDPSAGSTTITVGWHNESNVQYTTTALVPVDAWHHLAIVSKVNLSDSTYRDLLFYVNGVLVETSTPVLVEPVDWGVGADMSLTMGVNLSSGDTWTGKLDDCRFSKIARTGVEILTSYNRGIS